MDSITLEPQGFPQNPPPEGDLRVWFENGVLRVRMGSNPPEDLHPSQSILQELEGVDESTIVDIRNTIFSAAEGENVFLGSEGSESSVGISNTTLGYQAGKNLTVGNSNTLIGSKAGLNLAGSGDGNLFGALNTFIGTEAGGNTTTGYACVFIGQKAGNGNTTASATVAIGKSALAAGSHARCVVVGTTAGELSASGDDCVFIGWHAGNTASGNGNIIIGSTAAPGLVDENAVIIGAFAGQNLTTGSNNLIIGGAAGNSLTSGELNTLIGRRSGVTLTTQTGNVFIGTYSGESDVCSHSIVIGRQAKAGTMSNTFVAGSNAAGNTGYISNVFFGNGISDASPVAYVINGTGGSGSNIPGADVAIAGGRGTGTGASGKVNVQVAVPGSSGSSQNALTNAAQFDATTTAGQTRFLIYDVDNGTLERVTVGAADSGGSGYKVLRIAN